MNPYVIFRDSIFSLDGFIAITKLYPSSFINYCEVDILPDGMIMFASPSHQQSLLNHATKEQIEGCLTTEDLAEKMNIVLVWYDNLYIPKGVTSQQKNAIKCLRKEKLIR